MKICGESPNCLKSDKNVENFTRRPNYILFLPRRKFAVKIVLCNTKYFHIVDRDISSTIQTGRILEFALQQLLHERATKLRCTYIA